MRKSSFRLSNGGMSARASALLSLQHSRSQTRWLYRHAVLISLRAVPAQRISSIRKCCSHAWFRGREEVPCGWRVLIERPPIQLAVSCQSTRSTSHYKDRFDFSPFLSSYTPPPSPSSPTLPAAKFSPYSAMPPYAKGREVAACGTVSVDAHANSLHVNDFENHRELSDWTPHYPRRYPLRYTDG
jgi:hypothetical protein